jgi:regulatory protein
MQRGLALLARSARTASDLRERLAERFEEPAVEAAMARLAELGYVDDEAWAAAYMTRTRSAERSARALRLELRARGIAAELASEAVDAHDDTAAAREAARRLARASRGREPELRARRLRAAFARRGFGVETIARALAGLAEEERSAEAGARR